MKLTKTIRQKILASAMKNVPVIDYRDRLRPVVQDVLYKHMSDTVKAVYDDPETRLYLAARPLSIRDGNGYGGNYLTISSRFEGAPVYGLPPGADPYTIRVHDEVIKSMKRGTIHYDLARAVKQSGYFDAHYEQLRLIGDVRNRLNATLSSVTTTNRLYDVLEPELHHLIPADEDKTANLPAQAAPVVADLRKLGATLPRIRKAKQAAK